MTWSIRNNHGGGYSYRLCPLPEGNFTDLTEACFQEHPLDFVEDEQSIVFPDGTTKKLNASQTTFVTEGTTPPGSMWSMIPMVRIRIMDPNVLKMPLLPFMDRPCHKMD